MTLRTVLAKCVARHLRRPRPLLVQSWLWLAAEADALEEKRRCPARHTKTSSFTQNCSLIRGAPSGIRIRVATLKGWCPRPLDDGGTYTYYTRP